MKNLLLGFFSSSIYPIPNPHRVPPDTLKFIFTPFGDGYIPPFINFIEVNISLS